MIIKLVATLSYIDKFQRLKLTNPDDDSTRKLAQHVIGGIPAEITVSLPKGIKAPTPDMIAMLGKRVTIHVVVSTYKFVSQMEKNKGETVTGTKLTLDDIKELRHTQS